jgi:hypothetical protein
MEKHFRPITRPYDKHQKLKQLTPRTLNSEKEYKRLKKLLTHKTEHIDRTLKVSFAHPAKYHGWIYLTIETASTAVTIHCSYAYEPFDDFVWWLEGIRFNRSLHSWEIEEEGRYKKLFIYPVDTIHLRLVVVADDHYALEHCIYKEEHIVLDTIVRKEELIAQFYYAFKNFVNNDFKQSKWSKKREVDINSVFDNWSYCMSKHL